MALAPASNLARADCGEWMPPTPMMGSVADTLAGLGQALGREIEQRLAGKAAGFAGIVHARHRVAGDGGIGDDQPIEIGGEHHLGDGVERRLIQVRRDLEEHRHAHLGLGAGRQHLAQQPAQRLVALQIAQARRIGRGDVDGQVIGQFGEALDAQDIVGDEILAILVGADIDAERRRHAQALEPGEGGVMALIVEAHAIDDAFGLAARGTGAAWDCPPADAA